MTPKQPTIPAADVADLLLDIRRLLVEAGTDHDALIYVGGYLSGALTRILVGLNNSGGTALQSVADDAEMETLIGDIRRQQRTKAPSS
jgi:hypothetical protein